MHPTPAPPSRPKLKLPTWLTVVLSVFAVLFILGAVFGKPAPTPEPVAAPVTPPPATTSATTSVTPAPVTYTVDKITDAANVELIGSDGSHRTVHILGLEVATGNNCYATETTAWANNKLASAAVKITTDTADGVALALSDGTDYATAALSAGYARLSGSVISDSLRNAANAAQQAATGLWAEPCKGVITAPTPVPTPTPTPTPPKEAPAPPPDPRTAEQAAPPPVEDAPEPEQPSSAYYKNCAAAKAAGVTPLHRGDPGYRPGLDRDGDGIACER
ncbi:MULTISPECIES: excalibur calcium-binding domain-containing protein [Amycolatopsis]|uniref:Excalibur calcium-binding domain-containing protein n=1 Tax=Amycolatopsis dendrobii TaxID=2760662 RepID=A0A7W3ZDB8_9PSEU|nr:MULTISPECIES: excalibur calcium-binding domain-containing protein [Amycolatopsis]MBB1156719.1 excalibur calcium-binding domain-containing protein [Amycolatopsis dendrobii]UKD53428.1 excalibur calcium-binding domain-containing protein [Amycolatopsis sp. FU40]